MVANGPPPILSPVPSQGPHTLSPHREILTRNYLGYTVKGAAFSINILIFNYYILYNIDVKKLKFKVVYKILILRIFIISGF